MAESNRRRRLLVALGTIAGFYLLVCALAFAAQRRIVFPAPKNGRTPAEKVELVEVEAGTPMLLRRPAAGKPLVVYFHGNGEQIADSAWLAGHFGRSGVGFAAIEYPGYGLAATRGAPSEEALFAAAERGLRHLLEREGFDRTNLILAGQSLGTGVAMAMAERGFGARVIVFCPFTSLPDVGADVFPFLPVRLLLRDRFDSLARAERVQVPVLVLHGTDDELIPVKHGQRLAERLPKGRFVAIPGGHHNDLWNFPLVDREVSAFVNPRAPPPP